MNESTLLNSDGRIRVVDCARLGPRSIDILHILIIIIIIVIIIPEFRTRSNVPYSSGKQNALRHIGDRN